MHPPVRRRYPLLRLTLAACMLVPAWASAMTMMEVELTCPIGGKTFKQTLAGSGTAFGSFLDGMPYGPTPAPWPLPQCPDNGYIILKPEPTPAQMQTLTPFVLGTQYQRWVRDKETSYFLLAQLLRTLERPVEQQAYVMQQATWQASPAQYPRYAADTLALLGQVCADDAAVDAPWIHCQLLRGEFERRTGQFDAAHVRFTTLQPLVTQHPHEDEQMQQIIASIVVRQLELSAAKDSSRQRVPELDGADDDGDADAPH